MTADELCPEDVMGKCLIKTKIYALSYFSTVFIAFVHSVKKQQQKKLSAILVLFCE